jgi:hypothetical protein
LIARVFFLARTVDLLCVRQWSASYIDIYGFIFLKLDSEAGKQMLGILGMVAGIGSLICFIIVLIKQFQDAGAVHGIIGIVTCGIWTFIWGWMNAGRLNIKNIMMIWTLLFVISIALNILGGGFAFSFGTPTTTTP